MPKSEAYENLLLDAHLTMHGQRSVAGVLEAVARAGRRLGAPSYSGFLLVDDDSTLWRLTELVDPTGRPLNLLTLDLPLASLVFAPPARIAISNLADLLGAAWGNEACARIERSLGAVLAVCVAVPSDDLPRAALLALPTTFEQTALLASVLAHAATAVRPYLPVERAPLAGGILDPEALAARAGQELARAGRYDRPLAVVAIDLGRRPKPEEVGAVVLQRRRRWDLVGRLDVDRPMLAAVLPETDRRGAEGFSRRLMEGLPHVRTGAAVFPNDGSSLPSLIFAARRQVQ